MLSSSAAYEAAITGDTRRMYPKAVIDIIDPDIVYGTVDSSGVSSVCRPEQIHDKGMEVIPYATLEGNRWALNGQFKLFPLQGADHIGFLGDTLSGADGVFSRRAPSTSRRRSGTGCPPTLPWRSGREARPTTPR